LKFEDVIIYNLFNNIEYCGKVISFLKEEYFKGNELCQKYVFKVIKSFYVSYTSIPTKEALKIEIKNFKSLPQETYNQIIEYIDNELSNRIQPPDSIWLFDSTEKWCKKRAFCNAVLKSAELIDKEDATQDYSESAKMIEEALSVRFKTDVGHNYQEDSDKQWSFYKEQVEKIPFDLEFFNKITNGGLPRKTLTLIAAATNAGKSICLSHFAGSFLRQGKNVLFISCEMSVSEIRHRIDSNLLNINMDHFYSIDKSYYDSEVTRLKRKTQGNLFINEYPMGSASVAHFKVLLNELRITKNFIPDVIIIDYLNICASYRTRLKDSSNSYSYIKTISEEFKGLAQEMNVPVISATQFNRAGNKNPDADLDNISESMGSAMTSDLILGLIRTEELDKVEQVLWKQLKNRLNSVIKYRRFTTGLDYNHMRLYDVEQHFVETDSVSEQEKDLDGLQDKEDIPLFDRSPFGQSDNKSRKWKRR